MTRASALATAIGLLLAVAGPVSAQADGVTASGIGWQSEGAGPAVVFVHGSNLDRRLWQRETEALRGRFRILRYDARAHGASADVREGWSHVDDLAAVLDAAGEPRAVVVGLSMGATIALDFALAHPERVRGVVLASPQVSGWVPREPPAGMEPFMAALRAGDVTAAVDALAASPLFAAPPGDTLVARMVKDNARLFRQPRIAPRPLEPALGRLHSVAVPVLVISGSEDAADIRMNADTIAAAVPGARSLRLDGAGHVVNVWRPAAFLDALRAFLDGLGAPSDQNAEPKRR